MQKNKLLIIHSASTSLNQGLIYLREKYEDFEIDLLITAEHTHLDFHMLNGDVYSLKTSRFNITKKNESVLNKLKKNCYTEILILTRGHGIWATNYGNIEKVAKKLKPKEITVIDHLMNYNPLNLKLKIRRRFFSIKKKFFHYISIIRLFFWKLPLFLLIERNKN